jgi:hypothetical protein
MQHSKRDIGNMKGKIVNMKGDIHNRKHNINNMKRDILYIKSNNNKITLAIHDSTPYIRRISVVLCQIRRGM